MFVIRYLSILRSLQGRPLALLLLILLPLPVSIPLVLWLTGRSWRPNGPRGPLATPPTT
ncbi:MAG: hypothetical protein MRJ92_03815 [Nitrospira sp.]|jgi:hypothetical protein|nr:hypothetical protein [Nitrospira sp.]